MRHMKMLMLLCNHVLGLLASAYVKAQADPAKWCPYTALPGRLHRALFFDPTRTPDTFMRHMKMLMLLCTHVLVLLAGAYMTAQADPSKGFL